MGEYEFPKQVRRRFPKEISDYYEESDEEKDHRDATGKMYTSACAVGIIRLTLSNSPLWQPHPLRLRSDWEVNDIQIRIPAFDSIIYNQFDRGGWKSPTLFHFPKENISQLAFVRDFGEIRFNQLTSRHFAREIDSTDSERYEKFRDLEFELMDTDSLREARSHKKEPSSKECRRPKWIWYYFPNCNMFHEIDNTRHYEHEKLFDIDSHYASYYFSHGYYRDAWMVKNVNNREYSVLKMLRLVQHDFSAKTFSMVQRDAIVMERLTHSPYIVDMYGHCGFSLMVQHIENEIQEQIVPEGYMKQEELDDKYEVKPQNSYSTIEKLRFALSMAESLATLHGFQDGVIVHDDVQLCQWLRTRDNRLVLGDFNRAEIMKWNADKDEYCNHNNGYSFGNYRAPEEYNGQDLDEKIDIFSFGNNVYALLTGLWPFYENDDDTLVHSRLIAGNTSFIDERYQSRSYGEGKMVQLIEMCWKYKPEERPDIFEIVEFLRIVVEKVEAEDAENA
eukprot:CAMPEP_0178920390 /NCGR_PEP_ID=MMETSP0786-20121207/14979_1 /TAXON_ID=186022 /ORGANISM="Thalassionema frauenfeldii, Strain CCMP 1798" /LENGTH=503 /DNA_ID=CAMNT_0020594453 /DNA_START=77 /DNA_END=1588 /DNA_ORIENTATION=+